MKPGDLIIVKAWTQLFPVDSLTSRNSIVRDKEMLGIYLRPDRVAWRSYIVLISTGLFSVVDRTIKVYDESTQTWTSL